MKRKHRLSRSRDFDAVYRHGRSVTTRYLVLYAFARADDADLADIPRLGLAVSRRVGDAVARNQVKRWLREAFSQVVDDVPPGRDYVLIVRPGFAEATESQGFDWLVARVHEIFDLLPATERPA